MSTVGNVSAGNEQVWSEPGHTWAVVHTRPRCEKKVAAIARLRGVHIYLPLRQTTHRYGGRERRFSVPLFPGYMFCLSSDEELRQLRQDRQVANLLPVDDQEALVHCLQSIDTALQVGDVAEVLPYLKEGQVVRVRGGSLDGVEGVVERWVGKARIVINVEMLQQAVAIEVDAQDLVHL